MSRVALALAALLLLVFASPSWAQDVSEAPAPQTSIWFESRLGHVFVGPADDPGTDFLAYGYYFVAIGPTPTQETETYGDCMRDAVQYAAAGYRSEIASYTKYFPDQPPYSKDQIKRTRNAIVTARGNYKRRIVQKCGNVPQDIRRFLDGTSLALVRRECAALTCSDPALPTVRNDNSGGRLRELIFEATHYWVLESKLDLGANQVIKLAVSPSGGLQAETVEVAPAAQWPAPIPAADRFRLFEERARRIYELHDSRPMSATVAAQIALPKATVLRLAGAFDDPADAYAMARDAPEIALSVLQDEVAQIRIRECHDFRGKPDLASVAQCAGYALDEQEMLGCLSSSKCMPKFSGQVQAGALLMSARTSLEDLAKDAILPRPFSDAVGGFQKLANDTKTCASTLSISGQPTDDQFRQIQACVGKATIPDSIATPVGCLLSSSSDSRLGCLLSDEDKQRAETLKACLETRATNCIMQAALPSELACIGRAKSVADLACAGPIADVSAAAQCLADNSQTVDYVAKIRCVAGNRIGGAAGDMLDCYGSSTSQEAFAICAAGKALPPKQALLIKCAAESGGNYFSAGLCMAAPNLGLSPGQQILLQCAVSSGAPPAYAACVIGQFTFRELMGCRTAEFGQSGCFGETNEIQKLAKALTGSTISSQSVVGQVMVFYINGANGAVSGVGQMLSQAREGAENFKQGFNHEVDKIQDNPVQALVDTPGNILREGGKVLDNVGREVGKGVCHLLGC